MKYKNQIITTTKKDKSYLHNRFKNAMGIMIECLQYFYWDLTNTGKKYRNCNVRKGKSRKSEEENLEQGDIGIIMRFNTN